MGVAAVAAASVAQNNKQPVPGGGDAADDASFGGGGGCPPGCDEARKTLNRAYHAIEKYSNMPGSNPFIAAGMRARFRLQVRDFEKKCGGYSDPPSFDDIYSK